MDARTLLRRASDARALAQVQMVESGRGAYKIDEVSLLFRWPDELDRFVGGAVVAGAEHFNSVESDTMIRRGVSEGFIVRFEFLRMPEASWRIEAMLVIAGQAPLHQERLRRHGTGCVVHASFKCEDTDAYTRARARLARPPARLVKPMRELAEYRNSYGVFSYWQTEYGIQKEQPYFKPRVNLRDVAPDTLPVAPEPSA